MYELFLCWLVLDVFMSWMDVFMVVLNWIFGWIWMFVKCLDILRNNGIAWMLMWILSFVSGGFLIFQRKLCPNFQFFNMHMFRGSLLSFIESLLQSFMRVFFHHQKRGDCWTLVDFDNTKTLMLCFLIKLNKRFRMSIKILKRIFTNELSSLISSGQIRIPI